VLIVTSASVMTGLSCKWRNSGQTLGFVPTMGALHAGHISLVHISKSMTDRTAVSIFLNPAQFMEDEDLDRYPVSPEEDQRLLREASVDVLYLPGPEDIYPDGFSTWVEVEGLTDTLCGEYRPGHFRGVTTVCTVLFDIVRPDIAVFGQKDAQQLAVIRRLVRDLKLGIEIVGGSIVRESDGLAMSSRNRYLSPLQRTEAAAISRGLRCVREAVSGGVLTLAELVRVFRAETGLHPGLLVQYARLVDPYTMEDLSCIEKEALFAVAVFSGDTRLIDNVLLEAGTDPMEV
jgi:pantoate--beta-alanine ligase